MLKVKHGLTLSIILLIAILSTTGVNKLSAQGTAPAPLSVYKYDLCPKFDPPVTVNVIGDAGHNMVQYDFWADDFAKEGIKISQIGVGFNDIYEKEKAEFVAGSGAYDVVMFYPAYIGDFAGNGYLKPLDDYFTKSPASVWDPHQDDMIAPFRELYNKFGGKTYALTIDGDIHVFLYRTDLFNNKDEQAAFKAKYGKDLKPPETWDDYNQVGAFFTRKKGDKLAGQTLTDDFYGSAEFGQRGYSFAWFMDRAASAGVMYFDANMKPGINTKESVAALQSMVDSIKNAPPDVLSYGYQELADAFIKGKVAMVVQWSDVPKKGADPAQSTIVGKVGIGRVPGTKVGDTVVHRSMMPVGRVLAVTADSKVSDAAYCVVKHIAYDRSLEDVSTSLTGLDPYRPSHLEHPEAYVPLMGDQPSKDYLAGLKTSLPDGFPEIFIPGAAQYEDSLDLHVNKALAGQETPQAALDATAKEWDAITDKLGRDKQIQLWKSALDSYRTLGLIK